MITEKILKAECIKDFEIGSFVFNKGVAVNIDSLPVDDNGMVRVISENERMIVELDLGDFLYHFKVLTEEAPKNDPVHKPKHYEIMPDIESIELIARCCTMEMWKGACLFNVMKYRLRCGGKDKTEQELAKADNYAHTLYDKFLPLCYDYIKTP